MSGIVVLRTDAASAPFIRGIAKSNTIRSGFNFFACSIPSTPSVASPHTSKPACSKKSPMMFRTQSPSSTTKILLRKECLVGEGVASCCSYCAMLRLYGLDLFRGRGAIHTEHLKRVLINQVFTCFLFFQLWREV